MASLGTSILNAMIAIGIIFIPGFSRLARAATEVVLREQYVEAARTMGMGHGRIILREILPNIIAPLLVEAAVAFSYAILLESALSFLGLGAQPPEPSWGNMINTGRGFMSQAPMARHRAGHGDLLRGAGLQSPRRRPARHPRSAHEGLTMAASRNHQKAGATPTLSIEGLSIEFARPGGIDGVVDAVSLDVWPGEIVGSHRRIGQRQDAHVPCRTADAAAQGTDRRGKDPAQANAPSLSFRNARCASFAATAWRSFRRMPCESLNPTLRSADQVGEPARTAPRHLDAARRLPRRSPAARRSTSAEPQMRARRVPAPVLRRHAAAGDDCHGACACSPTPDRRRDRPPRST